jgi:hypothetical protein
MILCAKGLRRVDYLDVSMGTADSSVRLILIWSEPEWVGTHQEAYRQNGF